MTQPEYFHVEAITNARAAGTLLDEIHLNEEDDANLEALAELQKAKEGIAKFLDLMRDRVKVGQARA